MDVEFQSRRARPRGEVMGRSCRSFVRSSWFLVGMYDSWLRTRGVVYGMYGYKGCDGRWTRCETGPVGGMRRHNGGAIGSRVVVVVVVDRVARAREGVFVDVDVGCVGDVGRGCGGGVGRGTTADRGKARAVHARGERAGESARGDDVP